MKRERSRTRTDKLETEDKGKKKGDNEQLREKNAKGFLRRFSRE